MFSRKTKTTANKHPASSSTAVTAYWKYCQYVEVKPWAGLCYSAQNGHLNQYALCDCKPSNSDMEKTTESKCTQLAKHFLSNMFMSNPTILHSTQTERSAEIQ